MGSGATSQEGVGILKKGTTFSIGTSSYSKCILNEKIGKSRSDLGFRKLIKIAGNGIKIQESVWRYEIQFGILSMLATTSKYTLILN
jgi:hypothetical protein